MALTGDQITTFMIDVAWLSVLLLVGKLIRTKAVLLQKLFLPASVIAGFIGLALGPYILGQAGVQVIPQEMLDTWATFPGRLINVVFACLFLGFALRIAVSKRGMTVSLLNS